MSKPESKTAADSPLCGDPARYDRGECNWPKCGCDIKDDAPTQTATDPGVLPSLMHIASPRPQAGGRPNLCGAPQTTWNAYSGLDEAYRANVEGWTFPARPVCRDCLATAMIAMGVSP